MKLLTALRAAAESTRLRILSVLRSTELTVSELVEILNQSQPRVSRHLKLLCDSGLLERYREGAWVFYHLADTGKMSDIVRSIIEMIDLNDSIFNNDQSRLKDIKARNAEIATQYFSRNASEWDSIRHLAVPDIDLDLRLVASLTAIQKNGLFLDLGTGTGRILQVYSSYFDKCIGFDLNREMLQVARANLDSAGIENCIVRQGDIESLPLEPDTADFITLHQVLHYLNNPETAIAEAARVMKKNAHLVIVDFLPHDFEFLREIHAHRRLGFSDQTINSWAKSCNLSILNTEHLHPGNPEEKALSIGLWSLRK